MKVGTIIMKGLTLIFADFLFLEKQLVLLRFWFIVKMGTSLY